MVVAIQPVRERAAGRYRVILLQPEDGFWLITIHIPGHTLPLDELAYTNKDKALEAYQSMKDEISVNEILFPNTSPPIELLEPGSSEYWRAHDADVKLNRESRNEVFVNALKAASIGYVSKNNGAHLIINYKGLRVDLYPTKGGWRLAGNGRNRLTYGNPQQFIRWMNNRATEGGKRNRNRNRRKVSTTPPA
jgi:hypothetical protein